MLAVVSFHAGVSAVSGGFLGVDIFFVISGFLITSNILRDLSRSSFRFREFYARRILRLLPAAAATITATLAFSFVLYPPDEVVGIIWSGLAALASLSNLYFWSSAGYFDTSASLKPLLHTWSLGVEEQFYLVWPLLLVLVARGRGALLPFVMILASASLAACYWFLPRDPSAVFYLTPFRVFEFAIGISIAVMGGRARLSNPVAASALGGLGLAAIVYSIVALDSSVPLPSALSLVPCLGAAAIIVAGPSPVARVLLGSNPALYIGRISYSLYLVHWPIVTLLLAASIGTHPVVVVALCVIAATLQFYLVEHPFRRSSSTLGAIRLSTPVAGAGCAALILVAGAASAYGIATDGLRYRLPDELRSIPSAGEMWRARHPLARVRQCFVMPDQTFSGFDKEKCLERKAGKKNYLVVGDSFAADLYVALSSAFPDVNFLQATSASCTPFIGNTKDANCAALLDFVYRDYLPSNAALDGVVLAGGWGYELDDTQRTIDYLRSIHQRVILFGPPVRFRKNVPALIFESRALTVDAARQYVFANRHPGDGANPHIAKRFAKSVQFIDLHATMCPAGGCDLFTPAGKMIYIDFGHLTADGAHYLADRLRTTAAGVF